MPGVLPTFTNIKITLHAITPIKTELLAILASLPPQPTRMSSVPMTGHNSPSGLSHHVGNHAY